MTLKTWTLPSLGALALTVMMQPAFAADMPVKAPPMPAIAAYNWYGFYVGVHAGYGWGGDSVSFSGTTPGYGSQIPTLIPNSLSGSGSGFIGGVQYGSNYQFGNWVLGLESDFSWTDFGKSETVTLTSLGNTRINTAEQSLNWFGTTRARVGYAANNWLFFVTGGLANGSAEVTVSHPMVGVPCGIPMTCPRANEKDTLWGWALGGGIEVGQGPWSFKVEYLHYDLGDLTFNYSDGISPFALTASSNFSGDIVRGGINYRFNWTPWDILTGRARL